MSYSQTGNGFAMPSPRTVQPKYEPKLVYDDAGSVIGVLYDDPLDFVVDELSDVDWEKLLGVDTRTVDGDNETD